MGRMQGGAKSATLCTFGHLFDPCRMITVYTQNYWHIWRSGVKKNHDTNAAAEAIAAATGDLTLHPCPAKTSTIVSPRSTDIMTQNDPDFANPIDQRPGAGSPNAAPAVTPCDTNCGGWRWSNGKRGTRPFGVGRCDAGPRSGMATDFLGKRCRTTPLQPTPTSTRNGVCRMRSRKSPKRTTRRRTRIFARSTHGYGGILMPTETTSGAAVSLLSATHRDGVEGPARDHLERGSGYCQKISNVDRTTPPNVPDSVSEQALDVDFRSITLKVMFAVTPGVKEPRFCVRQTQRAVVRMRGVVAPSHCLSQVRSLLTTGVGRGSVC